MSLHEDQQCLNDILEAAHAAALEFLKSLPTRPAGRVPHLLPHDLLPEEGLGAMQALATFRSKYESGLSASPGPRYLGFVIGGSTPAALAGDWLVSTYDQNVGSDGDSIATTVERETLGLLCSLFGLSDLFEGAFVTGATMANFVALATARQWAAARLGIDVSEHGLWRYCQLKENCRDYSRENTEKVVTFPYFQGLLPTKSPVKWGAHGESSTTEFFKLTIPEYKHCHTFSDFWQVYRYISPVKTHCCVGKETGETAHMERWNNTLRQRLGRYTRQTLAFSKSDEYHYLITLGFIVQYNSSLSLTT